MKKIILLLFLTSILLSLFSEAVTFQYRLDPHYTIVERADYSKRKNGQYLGYVNREIRGIYESREQQPGVYQVEASWFKAQEIKKEGRYQALPLDHIERSRFTQNLSGTMSGFSDLKGPQFRNFPLFPSTPVFPGDRWEAPLSMIITDDSGDLKAEIPLYCGYQFLGEGEYHGSAVYLVEAQFALRYRRGSNARADQFLESLSGTHKVTLTIDKETLSPILMRDNFQEQHQYRNGTTLETRGFNLIFYEGISLLNRGETVENLSRSFGQDIRVIPGIVDSGEDSGREEAYRADESADHQQENLKEQMEGFTEEFQQSEITLYQRNDGLTLSLNNLHFVPDQAIILEEDRPLLDKIAGSLMNIVDKSLLVTGHTADVGSVESQIELSLERAKVVVDELIKRGIPADRFLYLGMGGSEPLADNSNEEGRALNRRVEITILED